MEKVGILCGFAAEAHVARTLSPLVAMSGAIEEKARERARQLVRDGATALLSFGVAGGLKPGLTSEDIIVADAIHAENGKSWACTQEFSRRLKQAIPSAHAGSVFGSTLLVPKPADKKKLYQKTGCVIVDMESHVIAEVATEYGLPFAVLRGVSDGIEDTFPQAALVAVNDDGSSNSKAMYRSLLLNPFQIPALMKLFHHTGISLTHLSQAIRAFKAA